MTFFERAHSAKVKTFQLIIIFVAIYLISATVLSVSINLTLSLFFRSKANFFNECIGIGLFIIVSMLLMTYLRKQEIKVGSEYVMKQLNAKEVNEFHNNPIVQRYYNVAAEMAISAGISLPRIFLLPSEEINALAVASNNEDISIAITEGALTRLSREELQGIIAHEISHILHKDCILKFQLVSWIFGLQCIYLYGRDIFQVVTGHYPKKLDEICLGYTNHFHYERTPLGFSVALVIIPMVIMFGGFISAVGARIVKSMISREREYLADAEAIRMTRSKALVEVLKKIAFIEFKDSEELEMQRTSSKYQEFSHFYLDDYEVEESIFDSHPPILKRIRAIDPKFRAPSADELEKMNALFYDNSNDEDREVVSELITYMSHKSSAVKHDQAGALGLHKSNEGFMNNISENYAVLLSSDQAVFKEQQIFLQKQLSENLYKRTIQCYESKVRMLNENEKLLMLIKSVPDFTAFRPENLQSYRHNIQHLITIDNKMSIFEYCVWKTLHLISEKNIFTEEHNGMEFKVQNKTILDLKNEVAKLMNIVLLQTFTDKKQAETRYQSFTEIIDAHLAFAPELNWYTVLEEVIGPLTSITPAGSDFMADTFNELYVLPEAAPNGQMLIHTLCLLLNIRLPSPLRYKKNDQPEMVQRINLYK